MDRTGLDNVSFHLVDAADPEAITSMQAYFDELDRRFPGGFDPGDTLVADAHKMGPPGGAFVIARIEETTLGCGGIQRIGPGVGEIKRMWIAPDARGRGLGPRLLAHLETTAADLGHTVIRLDTNSNLPEAVALYRRAGYREIERYNDNPYPDHFFEKALPQSPDTAAE